MEFGAQSVMTSGALLMPMLYADNWDSVIQVLISITESPGCHCTFTSRSRCTFPFCFWSGNWVYLAGQCWMCWN